MLTPGLEQAQSSTSQQTESLPMILVAVALPIANTRVELKVRHGFVSGPMNNIHVDEGRMHIIIVTSIAVITMM